MNKISSVNLHNLSFKNRQKGSDSFGSAFSSFQTSRSAVSAPPVVSAQVSSPVAKNDAYLSDNTTSSKSGLKYLFNATPDSYKDEIIVGGIALAVTAFAIFKGRNLSKQLTDVRGQLDDARRLIGEKANWFDGWLGRNTERISALENRPVAVAASSRNSNIVDVANNLALIENRANDGSRIELPQGVKDKLKKTATAIINGEPPAVKKNVLDNNSTVWSLTSESIPEKTGGLGEVPVQISRGFNSIAVDNYIVRPMINVPGTTHFEEFVDQATGLTSYTYRYGNVSMDLQKLVEFNVDAFQDGIASPKKVEVFVGLDSKGSKRLMFKNDEYFTGKTLYDDNYNSTEAQRYSFFSKAAYEFMKLKAKPASYPNVRIFNRKAFDNVKLPEAMILNDWQAGPVAALMRLKAQCELVNKEIPKDTLELFDKMNLHFIVHNLDYQGFGGAKSSDILNTLFGKYTRDIWENAETGFPYSGINKVITVDDSANLAHMGVSLADTVSPVSPTYARELAEQNGKSHALQHLVVTRLSKNTLEGISNGWDKAANDFSRPDSYGDNLNLDKLNIFKNRFTKAWNEFFDAEKAAGRNSNELSAANDVVSAAFADGRYKLSTLDSAIRQLEGLDYPVVKKALEEHRNSGLLTIRRIVPYSAADSIEKISQARVANKRSLLEYLQSLAKNQSDCGLILPHSQFTDLSDLLKLSNEQLDEVPVFTMGARFVSQKGVDVCAETIKQVSKEWAAKYPNRQSPVFLIGGADGEGGKWKNLFSSMKEGLAADGKRVIFMDGYVPNNIAQAGSDFSLYPSHFEPDGAKWESLYKGTPAICTRVGGHVDSIQDGVNGFLTARNLPDMEKVATKDGKLDEAALLAEKIKDYKEAFYKAVENFFDKPKRNAMIKKSMEGDQSWLIPDNAGNLVESQLFKHMRKLGFAFNADGTIPYKIKNPSGVVDAKEFGRMYTVPSPLKERIKLLEKFRKVLYEIHKKQNKITKDVNK